jgi:spermidine/putrescine transport system permease protein
MAGEYEQERGTGAFASMLRSVRQHPYTGLLVNIAPSAVWLGVFFMIPLAVMLLYSFGERGAFGQVLIGPEHLGLQQYATFFIPEGMSVTTAVWVTVAWLVERIVPFELGLAQATPTPYVQLTFRSIWYGLVATFVSFVVGYPMAYYVARLAPEKYQNLLIALVVLPYWASYLVRVYAIKLLLAKNGIVPTLATYLPFVDQQPALLFNAFSVQVGLIYIWIPFMILPAYASLEQIDFTLNEAAMDLGADRLDAFVHVTFPLSLPGVIAGSLLVFIPSVGAYVIPELLGGPSTVTIGNFIASQFGAAGNWPLGAAASFILMAIMLGGIALYLRRAGGDFL